MVCDTFKYFEIKKKSGEHDEICSCMNRLANADTELSLLYILLDNLFEGLINDPTRTHAKCDKIIENAFKVQSSAVQINFGICVHCR